MYKIASTFENCEGPSHYFGHKTEGSGGPGLVRSNATAVACSAENDLNFGLKIAPVVNKIILLSLPYRSVYTISSIKFHFVCVFSDFQVGPLASPKFENLV